MHRPAQVGGGSRGSRVHEARSRPSGACPADQGSWLLEIRHREAGPARSGVWPSGCSGQQAWATPGGEGALRLGERTEQLGVRVRGRCMGQLGWRGVSCGAGRWDSEVPGAARPGAAGETGTEGALGPPRVHRDPSHEPDTRSCSLETRFTSSVPVSKLATHLRSSPAKPHYSAGSRIVRYLSQKSKENKASQENHLHSGPRRPE